MRHFLCHFDTTVTMLTMFIALLSIVYKCEYKPHSVIVLLKKVQQQMYIYIDSHPKLMRFIVHRRKHPACKSLGFFLIMQCMVTYEGTSLNLWTSPCSQHLEMACFFTQQTEAVQTMKSNQMTELKQYIIQRFQIQPISCPVQNNEISTSSLWC